MAQALHSWKERKHLRPFSDHGASPQDRYRLTDHGSAPWATTESSEDKSTTLPWLVKELNHDKGYKEHLI